MEIVNNNTRSYELDVLYDLVYSYYPKGISYKKEREKYITSPQFKLLKKRIDAQNIYQSNIEKILSSIHSTLSKEMSFRNSSRFSWFDRAYNFHYFLRKNNFLHSICINISTLIPYYSMYVIEVELKANGLEWADKPRRNIELEKSSYNYQISEISSKIEEKLHLNCFPTAGFDIVIPELSFQDIEAGKFTLFNAYFLDEFFIN